MVSLVRDLDAEIEERSLLKHTFYKMWSDGKLTRQHLAGYAQEYFQLVRSVPELVGTIGGLVKDDSTKKVVDGIQREETQHVELWAKFAQSLGVRKSDLLSHRGTPKTRRAVARLEKTTGQSFVEGASAMYAIEKEQPKISRIKLDGLKAFYGMTGTEQGTEYFREHEVTDVRHAAVWRSLIQRERENGSGGGSARAAETSLKVQNAILDAVMETYVSPTISAR